MIQRLRRTTKSICAAWVPAEARTQPIEVRVRLCSDDEIQALNAEWRGKDQPTDVLSFPVCWADTRLGADARRRGHLGRYGGAASASSAAQPKR